MDNPHVFTKHDFQNQRKQDNRHVINSVPQKHYYRRKRLHNVILIRSSTPRTRSAKGGRYDVLEDEVCSTTATEFVSKDSITEDFSGEWATPGSSFEQSPLYEKEEEVEHVTLWLDPASLMDKPFSNRRIRHTAVHPSTIMRKGNSDPFGSLAVSVDPLVNSLMTFSRDCFLPSLYGWELTVAPKRSYYSQGWQETVSTLYDECKAYASLSRCAAVMASATSNRSLQLKAITYKTQASRLLRSRITEQDSPDNSTYWLINALLGAELAAHNFANAVIHGQMLSHMWQKVDSSNIDPRLLHNAFYNDIQRASVSLSRPCFDFEEWAPKQAHADWSGIVQSEGEQYYKDGPRTLDLGLEDEALRAIYIDLMELLKYFRILFSHPEVAAMNVFLRISTQCLVCEGRLLTYYLNIVGDTPGLETETQVPTNLSAREYASASGCLAALYWSRRVADRESLGINSRISKTGSRVYDAGPLIMRNLKQALSMWKVTDDEAHFSSLSCSRLRLWILYVGVLAEQHPFRIPDSDQDSLFHSKEFARLANEMRLFSWTAVKDVLEGYLYTDMMAPHGSVWFPKVMRFSSQ